MNLSLVSGQCLFMSRKAAWFTNAAAHPVTVLLPSTPCAPLSAAHATELATSTTVSPTPALAEDGATRRRSRTPPGESRKGGDAVAPDLRALGLWDELSLLFPTERSPLDELPLIKEVTTLTRREAGFLRRVILSWLSMRAMSTTLSSRPGPLRTAAFSRRPSQRESRMRTVIGTAVNSASCVACAMLSRSVNPRTNAKVEAHVAICTKGLKMSTADAVLG